MEEKKSFSEKHPRINALLGLLLLVIIVAVGLVLFQKALDFVLVCIRRLLSSLKVFVNSTDQIIVVAMITGTVSIVGVLISSVIAKIIDYRYNVKKYLYDKREEPYKQFIEMIYKMMEDTKNTGKNKLSEKELVIMLTEISKGLTLWGSNRVVKKWLRYRDAALKGSPNDMLFKVEDIIYEIRRDVGLGRRLKKGAMLSFFINDMDVLFGKDNKNES